MLKNIYKILIFSIVFGLVFFAFTQISGVNFTASLLGEKSKVKAQQENTEPDEGEPSNAAAEGLTQTLDETNNLSENLRSSNVTAAWGFVLDFVNVIAIFALLAIAFASILHIDVETYNIKRMLPALIIGLILANLSHLICRAIIDFATMLMQYLIPYEQRGEFVRDLIEGIFGGFTNLVGVGAAGLVGGIIGFFFGGVGCGILAVTVIILTFPVIVMVILWFLLFIRTYVVWLLVILSPLVFFGMFLPPTQKIVGQWWGQFLRWVFMGPIVFFILAVTRQFALGMEPGSSGTTFSDAADVHGISRWLFSMAMMCFAIFVPFALGGDLMKMWGKAGKWLGLGGAKAVSGTTAGLTKAGGKKLEAWGKRRGGALGGIAKSLGGRMSTQMAPHLIVPAARAYLEDKEKADVAETKRQMQRTARKYIPGTLRNQSAEWAREQGETAGVRQSSASLKEWAMAGIRTGDERNIAASVYGLSVRAQHADVSMAERMEATRVLRDDFGVTIDEASAIPINLTTDPDNAVALIQRQYKMRKDPRTGRREPQRVWRRTLARSTSEKHEAAMRRGGRAREIPTTEEQLESGAIPQEAHAIYNLERERDPDQLPPRFERPREEEEEGRRGGGGEIEPGGAGI